MKNLILTMGILMLMITGMVYDQDCRRLTEAERRLKWVCEEASYGAAVTLWREGKSMQEAEATAEEILQRNLDSAQWDMKMKDGIVEIRVNLGEADMQLPFLQGMIQVERRDTFDFSEIFFWEKGRNILKNRAKAYKISMLFL